MEEQPVEEPVLAEVVGPTDPVRVFSAPRRFDITTMMVVTVAYALMLSAMRLLSFEPAYQAAVAGYVSGVGLGQALLFKGKKPREASVAAGGVTMLAIVACIAVAAGGLSGSLISGAFCLTTTGLILGYPTGALVGGVFLIAEALRNAFGSRTVQ